MTTTQYDEFLASKRIEVAPSGFEVDGAAINPMLFPFQRDIVLWALRRGKAAIFADCGLGKTPMQLEWARHVVEHSGGDVLILAPLAVSQQTVREGQKFGIAVNICRSQADVKPGINITNYEMLDHFTATAFQGLVMDESSLLKAYEGVFRKKITEFGKAIPYRLAATATPAPNDMIEITNHAEFLEIMGGKEIIALFFTQDGNSTHNWRLKGHAKEDFWAWMASWSVALRSPSDLGYDDADFILPPLQLHQVTVEADAPEGMLFPVEALSLLERRRARRDSLSERVAATINLIHTQNIEYNFGYEQQHLSRQKSLHEGMARQQSGTSEGAAGRDEGSEECPSPSIVRGGSGTSGKTEETSKGVVGSASGKEEERTFDSESRHRSDGFSGYVGSAEGELRDLRPFGSEGQELLPSGGSRSRDGQGARLVMHELQSGFGEVQGQPRHFDSSGNVSLPPKWLIWCNLNDEQDALYRECQRMGISVVSIDGRTPRDSRIELEESWRVGDVQVMISKPMVFGHGMNWQHCAHMAFVGLSDSWEQYYQAIRRCWRFGQTRPVQVYVITAETEGAVVKNIERKEAQATVMMENIVHHMATLSLVQARRGEMDYKEGVATGRDWTLYLGDSIARIDEIASESVGLSVFSPPFPGMYAYTNSVHDIGNCADIDSMIDHFRYLVTKDKLYRIMMPGRHVCIHLCQLTAMKSREGYIGLHDYRGRVIQMMIEEGWIYSGEVTIDKNPQIQATRNKERGLLFKSLATDSNMMRMALADYLIYFTKPGENPTPMRAGMSQKYNPGGGWITEAEWVEWAAPVWYRHVSRSGQLAVQQPDYPSLSAEALQVRATDDGTTRLNGIMETDVLNVRQARETDDERHLAPLQLSVIERAVKLWSAPGDLVFSPFAGIGSEGYVSLKFGRRFAGIELKESYWCSAIENLKSAESRTQEQTLFSFVGMDLSGNDMDMDDKA